MHEDHQTQTDTHKIEHYEDEIELMDYLLVIWKWKYVIIAVTLAFGFAAGIISFIAWKQQPTMYRTSIVLKPGIVKIDEKGEKVFIDTPENIKALIENDLKFKVLEHIKNSNNLELLNSLNFQVDILKGSDIINVSLKSPAVEDSATKLKYLIKSLLAEYANKIEYFKSGIDEQIEQNKNKIADFQTKMENIKTNYLNQIEQKKIQLTELLYKEKRIKRQIEYYQQELSGIESKIKLLEGSNGISQGKEYFLNKLSLENDYRNTFQKYFEINENANFYLLELQKKISAVSKEIKGFNKTKNNIKADPILQSSLGNIQKDIIKATKDIETLEKKKPNIQNIQIIQPPVTTELPKINKIRSNLVLSSVLGLFLMLFSSFFLEYLSNYKKRVSNK
jgi:capsular polysaccharide biosynthesis protein